MPTAHSVLLGTPLDLSGAFYVLKQLNFEQEIWKDILGYEGLYLVSNLGRVKSLKRKVNSRFGKHRTVNERILNNILSIHGYLTVTLCKEKKTIQRVNRLVAIAFVPNPNNLPLVDHINGDKTNNNADNLRWCTCRENVSFNNIKRKQQPASKYVGVFLVKGGATQKWRSQIGVKGKNVYLGHFHTEEEASQVYQNALSNL